jgi:hypothetical protein
LRQQFAANPGYDPDRVPSEQQLVFRGYSPGQHINAISLRDRLRQQIFSARAARLGTLHELTKRAPVAIIAEALDHSPATIENHAKAASTPATSQQSSTPSDHPRRVTSSKTR